MNILIDPLPECITMDGQDWRINSSLAISIMFELLMQDPDFTREEKVRQALALYYPKIPPDTTKAIDGILWFYRCGREEKRAGRETGTPPPKAYCFEQDAELILSAFWQYYRIDLNAENDLHWWKFRALFRGLPSECELCKIMGYRTVDLKALPKGQKEFYKKMRSRYAIRNNTDIAGAISSEEHDQRMKDYIARRFAEVGERH